MKLSTVSANGVDNNWNSNQSCCGNGHPSDCSYRHALHLELRHTAEDDPTKPLLIYLPGIELSGYSLHRQLPGLAEDFCVRWLAVPPDDRSSFEALREAVTREVEAEEGRPIYLLGEWRLPAHCETMGVRLNHATSAWSHRPRGQIHLLWSRSTQSLVSRV